MLRQGLRHTRVEQGRVRGQIDIGLGPAVDLAQFEVHQPLAQSTVGDQLVCCRDGEVDVEATAVGFFTILAEHQLAGRFGYVLTVHQAVVLAAVAQDLGQGLVVLGFGDETAREHAFNDVALANGGALGVRNRVVGRRRLG